MKRRDFLTTSAALAVAPAIAVTPARAAGHAQGLTIAQRHAVGSLTVTAISDGFLPIAHEVLQGIEKTDFDDALAAARLSGPAHPTGVNAFLIEDGTRTVLIDAGTGTAFGPTLGHLGEHLQAIGADPASIDHIVATHLHPDHIGGAFVDGTNPFPQAELVVSDADLNFWTSEDIKAQAPDEAKGFFDLAMGAVASFGDRLRPVSGEAAIAPGLTAVPLPGHTPGHMGVMIESDGDRLLIWGDIIHVGAVQFARPEVTIAFDTDQELAAATRKTTLEMAVADDLKIAGAHIGFPGIGYVTKSGTGYGWEPARFPYG